MRYIALLFCVGINTSTAIGAFTYPHGALTTFEVAYGPRGWYLRHRYSSSSRTWFEPVRTRTTTTTTSTTTTSQLPFIKWDYTWYFSRPSRTRVLTTRRRSTTIVTPTTTTTISSTTTTVMTTSTTGFSSR